MSIGEYQIPVMSKGEDEKNWDQQAEVVETGNFSFEDLAFENQSKKEVSKEAAERAHNYRLKLEQAKRGFEEAIQSKKRKAFGAKIVSIFKRQAV